MAEITAAMVKQLRDQTGAGMMECKAALTEAKGDMEEAVTLLRRRGSEAGGAMLRVAAADPLNLQGILTPDDRIPATLRRRVAVGLAPPAPEPAPGGAGRSAVLP